MEDIINMIIANESPSDISDKIKQVLYTKSIDNVDSLRPYVASSIFGDDEYSEEG